MAGISNLIIIKYNINVLGYTPVTITSQDVSNK